MRLRCRGWPTQRWCAGSIHNLGVTPSITPAFPQRVLITGVSNPLGAEVARRLATQGPSLFGCDVADPVSAIEEMDFVHADTRQSVIGKLVRQLRIDTVVHMAATVASAAEDRLAHETNVIGTMNVLAGCAGPSSPVRRLVVKSSQAVYGAAPGDPSLLTEQVAGSDRPAYGLKRDLLEMEQLAQEFSLRTSGCSVCMLRLGYRVGEGTKLGSYLSLPIVPTFAGFDPRLQFLHDDDAAEAFVRATMGAHEGVFNVAADGIDGPTDNCAREQRAAPPQQQGQSGRAAARLSPASAQTHPPTPAPGAHVRDSGHQRVVHAPARDDRPRGHRHESRHGGHPVSVPAGRAGSARPQLPGRRLLVRRGGGRVLPVCGQGPGFRFLARGEGWARAQHAP